jgi:hypothetical protein
MGCGCREIAESRTDAWVVVIEYGAFGDGSMRAAVGKKQLHVVVIRMLVAEVLGAASDSRFLASLGMTNFLFL